MVQSLSPKKKSTSSYHVDGYQSSLRSVRDLPRRRDSWSKSATGVSFVLLPVSPVVFFVDRKYSPVVYERVLGGLFFLESMITCLYPLYGVRSFLRPFHSQVKMVEDSPSSSLNSYL